MNKALGRLYNLARTSNYYTQIKNPIGAIQTCNFSKTNDSNQQQTIPSVDTKSENQLTKSTLDPLKHPDFFQVHKLFTLKDLFDANVHLGHKEGSLNQCMNQFVFGSRIDQLIIDLEETTTLLHAALNFIAHIAYRNGIILFVSQSKMTSFWVEKTAAECGEYSHVRQWGAGTLTNSTAKFGGVIPHPDLIIFVHSQKNIFESHPAVADAAKLSIPSVGIVDTNCDPRLISYPIPGNDDSLSAVQLYCKLFKEAILLGKKKREEMSADS